MPRSRAYSRKELQSLRRADLQTLYKVHGLKGANQKSDVLLDTLLSHFASSSFATSRPTSPPFARRLKSIEMQVPQGKGLRSTLKDVGKGGRRGKGVGRGMDVVAPEKMLMGTMMEEVRPAFNVQDIVTAGPSRSPSPRPPPLVSQAESADPTDPLTSIHLRLDRLESQQPSVTRTELEELRSEIRAGRGPPETHSGVSEARMRELLAENDRTWTERLRLLEEAWRARLAGLEGILSSRLTTLEERTKYWEEGVPRNPASAQPKPLPEFTLTSETPASVRARLGKRPHGDTPSTTLPSRHDLSDPTPARKRARIDLREQSVEAVDDEGDSRTLDEPRTPSPPKAVPVTFKTPSLPHTPSPGHQGVSSDNSATPIVGTDYFANPPHLSASSRKRKRAIEELPYPIFATTPKPSEPVSPTTDAPPSASRGRNAAAAMLTPGRVRKESTPAPRAVSNAHKELSTITESDETPIHRRSRVPSDVPTPAFLGPELELDRRPGTASPTGLSPSPSIDAGPSYIPAPSVSRRVFSATSSRPHRGSSSPARDYMNVALHGLRNDTESPSAQATPGHRTMLGTERYRDTRFGDVPVFQWGTPSVDLGPGTPGQAQREW